MSLNVSSSAAAGVGLKCVLKTADQYDMWKARVSDACWCATTKDVFNVSDEECKKAIAVLEDPEVKGEPKGEWVGKCWTIITSSLHDDVYMKVTHVSRGLIKSLLTEIAHALVVNNLEEVAPLRLELYNGSMQKDCGSDLQCWINFILERAGKLIFLKKEVPQEELVSIFLKRPTSCSFPATASVLLNSWPNAKNIRLSGRHNSQICLQPRSGLGTRKA